MDWVLLIGLFLAGYFMIGTVLFGFLYFFEKAPFREAVWDGYLWLPLTILSIISEGWS